MKYQMVGLKVDYQNLINRKQGTTLLSEDDFVKMCGK